MQRAEGRCSELAVELDGVRRPTGQLRARGGRQRAQADGQLEQRILDASAELSDAVDLLDGGLRELEPVAEADALRAMRPPSSVAVEQFADEREQLDLDARDLAERRERLDQDSREARQDSARLALGTNVPTLEDLERRARGARRRVAAPAPALRGCRRCSRRPRTRSRGICAAATTSATGCALKPTASPCDAQLTVAGAAPGRRARIARASASNSSPRTAPSIERRWAQAWASTGIAPASPREMADWLRARQTVLERADTVARRRRNLEAEQRTRDGQTETLKAQLRARPRDRGPVATLSSAARDGPGTSGRGASGSRRARPARPRPARAHRQPLTISARRPTSCRRRAGGLGPEWAQIVARELVAGLTIGADSARQVLATVSELAVQLQEVDAAERSRQRHRGPP